MSSKQLRKDVPIFWYSIYRSIVAKGEKHAKHSTTKRRYLLVLSIGKFVGTTLQYSKR